MPPKKAAPQPTLPPPPKSSFFRPGAHKYAETPQPTAAPLDSSSKRPRFAPRRSFLYNKDTGEPYAEWICNEAVCLETGEVLFVSKRGDDFGFGGSFNQDARFDFSPPTQAHPKDHSIASQDLIDKGLLTLDDFRAGKAGLSAEACCKYMQLRKGA